MLINITDNAIKFTREGGEVLVRAVAEVDASRRAIKAQFIVQDTVRPKNDTTRVYNHLRVARAHTFANDAFAFCSHTCRVSGLRRIK